ncbi:PHA/PHB synthase family protein [Roseibium sp.]|uniref:PHA/PHB synthase family protein n=1 Tax=Roseibium sp. TaxID=1936156 RepID=UPI003B524D04
MADIAGRIELSPNDLNALAPDPDVGLLKAAGTPELYKPEMAELKKPYPFDRLLHATMARATAGISPISVSMAFFDWAAHLAVYPSRRSELARCAADKWLAYLAYLCQAAADQEAVPVAEPEPRDRRFKHEGWSVWPFNAYQQAFLLGEQWWDEATKGIHGVSRHHSNVVNFAVRQLVDTLSPSNVPWMNPEVMETARTHCGANFVKGFGNFLEDMRLLADGGLPPGNGDFRPGKEVAITPGKVVYRNHLMELIQYSPATDKVYAEPVFIVPAWIMKYYTLDLTPQNSLVKYLVNKGHTVFMVSWRNPEAADRDLGFEDYIKMGVLEGLSAVSHIVPNQKIHAVGYCLGGTLLMAAAAALAKRPAHDLKSITLFAAQVDFEEAGELMLFTDDSQLAYTEDQMWEQGYLDKHQMAGAFSMLRSNDLIWSRLIHSYLIGERRPPNDLMAWNSDATRMPYRMHSEYLRKLYLNNELSEGHFKVEGKAVALRDIKVPIFAVGTISDHVAPWTSVYMLNLYTDTDVTFVLTSGGHNAGIVNPPGNPKRHYQIASKAENAKYIHPSKWIETVPRQEGSWWPAWQTWINELSGEQTTPPSMGGAAAPYFVLCDAPGTYVHQT